MVRRVIRGSNREPETNFNLIGNKKKKGRKKREI
jgi:hypothetical protein